MAALSIQPPKVMPRWPTPRCRPHARCLALPMSMPYAPSLCRHLRESQRPRCVSILVEEYSCIATTCRSGGKPSSTFHDHDHLTLGGHVLDLVSPDRRPSWVCSTYSMECRM